MKKRWLTQALFIVVGVALGVAAVLVNWPAIDVRHWLPDLLVGWAFLGSGLVIGSRAAGRRQGLLVAAVGATWFLPDLVALLPLIYRGALVHAALAMPRGRLGSWWGRAVAAAAYAVSVPPALATNQQVVLALACAVLLVSARAAGAKRDAGLIVGGLLALAAGAHLIAPVQANETLLLLYEAGLCATAVALTTLHSSSARRADVTDLVVELGPQDALADLVRRDPSVHDDPAFEAAVAAADRLLAANALLTRELEQRIADVAASRGRLLKAHDAERAALEERLQHGPLGRLDHIAAGLTSVSSGDLVAEARLEAARDQTKETRSDLARIAHGLFPAAAADGSLESALEVVATTSPVPVALSLHVTRVDPAIAATAYFICAEAVANAVRHSAAQRITITVRRHELDTGSEIVIEVVDDGRGGADPSRGTGLLGLADRVGVADGQLGVASEPGTGTTVTATLPEGPPELSAEE